MGGSASKNGGGGAANLAAALGPGSVLPNENPALEKALNGKFDPLDFFGGAISDAKLLGVVKLADIVKVVLKEAIGNLGDAPQMVRNTIYNVGAAIESIIPAIIGRLEDVDRLLSQAPDQLKQRLQPPRQELSNARHELEKARDLINSNDLKKIEEGRFAALAAVGHAIQAGKQLVDECRRLANDPLGALGINIEALKQSFFGVLNDVRSLINKEAVLAEIQAQVRSAATNFRQALESSGVAGEAKEYFKRVNDEIDSVRTRLESTLADLQKELGPAQDILNANLGQILSLTGQFIKDAKELKDRYDELTSAISSISGSVADVGPALNHLMRLKVVQDVSGTAEARLKELALTFQTTRADLEDKWKENALRSDVTSAIANLETAINQAIQNASAAQKAELEKNKKILIDFRAKGEKLYAQSQAALRAIHDLPESSAKSNDIRQARSDLSRTRNILDDYTNVYSFEPLTAQRDFLKSLLEFEQLSEEIKSTDILGGAEQDALRQTVDKLTESMVKAAKDYTVIGKYLNDAANTANQIRTISNVLVGKLKDDVNQFGCELLGSAFDPNCSGNGMPADPFLENAVKAIEKVDVFRDRVTYVFLMAGSAINNTAGPFIQSYNNLRTKLDQYQGEVREAAGSLGKVLLIFKTDVPDVLRPAVAALLDNLIGELTAFQANGKVEELPRLLQNFLRLRDQVIGLLRNPADELPKLINLREVTEKFLQEFGIPKKITLSFDWKPPLKDPSWKIFETNAGGELTDFVIKADAIVDLERPTAAPAFNITGRLTNFKLNLLPNPQFIILTFKLLEFKSQSGGPIAVNAKIDDIQFGEALSFVKELAEILNPSSGPFLDIKPSGITAGFRFGWPMIPVGSMILYGLNIFAGITLPFNGDPMRLRLGVSDQARPFLLAVGVYAGGGFLALELDASGLQKVEGALEFGAHVELNFFGIAKGHGSVMAGFYFSAERKYKQSGEAFTAAKLCGYVRASGELSILGLITQSLDILVQVCWETPNRVYGRATVTVEISMLFFSVSVKVTAEYTFAGSEGGNQHHAARTISGAAVKALPEADDVSAATKKPIFADAFRWEDFQRAFHD